MSRELFGNIKAAATPVAALTLGIPLLQHHSIEFLTAWKTGAPASWDTAMLLAPWSGWGWSLLLEVVALWMWYERGAVRRAMAALATAALLFGPVYLTVSTEAEGWTAIKGSAALAGMDAPRIAGDIAEKKRTLETYRKNSEQRVGWQTQIENAEKELAALREDQKANDRRVLAGQGWPWALIAKAAGWITIILLCGFANVAAITSISRRFNPEISEIGDVPDGRQSHTGPAIAPDAISEIGTDRPSGISEIGPSEISEIPPAQFRKPVSVSPAAPPKLNLFTLKTLIDNLDAHTARGGITPKEFCALHGISEPDISCLRIWVRTGKTPARKPARKTVEALTQILKSGEARNE